MLPCETVPASHKPPQHCYLLENSVCAQQPVEVWYDVFHFFWSLRPLVCEDIQADVEDGQLQFFYILAFVLQGDTFTYSAKKYLILQHFLFNTSGGIGSYLHFFHQTLRLHLLVERWDFKTQHVKKKWLLKMQRAVLLTLITECGTILSPSFLDSHWCCLCINATKDISHLCLAYNENKTSRRSQIKKHSSRTKAKSYCRSKSPHNIPAIPEIKRSARKIC